MLGFSVLYSLHIQFRSHVSVCASRTFQRPSILSSHPPDLGSPSTQMALTPSQLPYSPSYSYTPDSPSSQKNLF